MTTQLRQTIEQDGYAQVIAVLEFGSAAGAEQAPDLAGHFLDPALPGERPAGAVFASGEREGLALAAPTRLVAAEAASAPLPKVRIYPRLGLALGFVDRDGLDGLCAA